MARKVMIGTPCMDGKPCAQYLDGVVEAVRLGVQRGIGIFPYLLCYDSINQNVRNDIVRDAYIKYPVDDLIWVDSDQSFDPEWIFRLLSYPVDCVGGTVRKKTDDAELYNVKTLHGPTALKPSAIEGLWEGEDLALGTGFTRMSRRALQVLWDNSESYCAYGAEEARWIFDIRPVNGKLVGEDIAVSDKLRRFGIPTYMDPTMTCGHLGTKHYKGDFLAWITKAQAAEAAEANAAAQRNYAIGGAVALPPDIRQDTIDALRAFQAARDARAVASS